MTGIGSLSNTVVKYANGGRMPVITEYYIDTERHFSAWEKDDVHFRVLSDWIRVDIGSDTTSFIIRYIDFFSGIAILPEEIVFYISPGDILIDVGMFLFAHILSIATACFIFQRIARNVQNTAS